MFDFLIYSGYFILAINLILYSISFFRSKEANIFFLAYLVFASLMQFCMEVMSHFRINNLFAVNIFFIGQMIFLGLFYKSILKNKKQKSFLNYCLISALLILFFQFIIDYNQFLVFNLFGITVTSIIILIFALLHFYNMLTYEKEYYFLNIGVVFYLCSSTVLYLVGNLIAGLNSSLQYLSWTLNALLLILYYLFILYEWKVRYCQHKK